MPTPTENAAPNATWTVPSVWKDAADNWTAGVQRVFALMPLHVPVASVDPTGVFDQSFDAGRRLLDMSEFAARLVEVNREYVHNLTGAALSTRDAALKHAGDVTDVVRAQVVALAGVARGQAEGLAQLGREQVQAVEQARQEAANELRDAARQAEREVRRQAREAQRAARAEAMETYADLTKPELQAELARRELPKTGSVGELRERLVDADVALSAA